MCGIAGFYKKGEKVPSPFDAQKTNQIQRHRGPDFQSAIKLNDNKVGLFHQRLSIMDLSDEGNQPMTVECDRCGNGLWLIYNGEIYNYPELKNDLTLRGHVFRSHCDSEVILHLYAEYGLASFEKLNGIFSFALYDGRDNSRSNEIIKNDLIIVRDQIGVKPLYFSNNDSYFSFSSELKTLLLDSQLSRELDISAVNDYLTYLWCPYPNTMLKKVKKVKPGHYLIIRDGQLLKDRQYYEIPLTPENNKKKNDEQSIIFEAQKYIEEAVRSQIQADVPIGAFLSGGLDSSAIVAMMKKLDPGARIDCYTIGFKQNGKREGFSEDLPYAERVAKHLGVNLNTLVIEPNIFRKIPEMLYYLDEPQADPAPLNAMLIAEHAKKDGYKVLMSGAGGDDIFSGYRRHYALNIDKKFAYFPLGIRRLLASYSKSASLGRGKFQNNATIRRLTKLLTYSDLEGHEKLASYFCWNHQLLRDKLMLDSVKSQLTVGDRSTLLEQLANYDSNYSELDKMLFLECKHFLSDHNLNYTDKVTMAHGIETRVPLLDSKLVEFAYSLPSDIKQKGRVGKYIFKKAMEDYLPLDIIYRPKTGFGAPLRQWINGEMYAAINEVLSSSNIKKRGLFDYTEIKKLIKANQEGKVDGSYTIFSLFCIELWCQTFIDNATPQVIDMWS